jgi:tripartite-type tricarboxylate transporter receptor subunit TctC
MALFVLVGSLGCSQQAVRGTHLKMKMFASQQAVLLVVDGDGRISYGGGFDAIQEKTSWQGKITSDQQLQFDELITSSGWLEPDSTRSQQSQGYDIRIQQGTIDNSFLLPLSDKSATTMFELLQTIALVRLEPTLNALPKPSMDTIIDRKVNSRN